MGIVEISLLWVMQELYHQPYGLLSGPSICYMSTWTLRDLGLMSWGLQTKGFKTEWQQRSYWHYY